MSTPDSSGRHLAGRPADPWPPLTDEPAGVPPSRHMGPDRGSPYYEELRELGDDRDSPYYRNLRGPFDDDYDDDVPYDRGPDFDAPASRVGRRLLSAILCLVLTPLAIAAMTYGADRYADLTLAQAGAERDVRGLAALGIGAGVLLIVACLGALSSIGPLLSGVVWGLVPAVLFVLYPREVEREVLDLPVLPDSALTGMVTWLGYGVLAMLGAVLIGAGLAAAMRRPART